MLPSVLTPSPAAAGAVKGDVMSPRKVLSDVALVEQIAAVRINDFEVFCRHQGGGIVVSTPLSSMVPSPSRSKALDLIVVGGEVDTDIHVTG